MRHHLTIGPAAAALACGLAAQPACAAEAVAAGVNEAQAGTVSAGAQSQADTDGGDIIVTARRREESVQDTPVAVTALSGDALEQASITNITQLAAQTPSLVTLPPANSSTTTYLIIRGQWGGDIRLTIDPTVATYVDNVYLPRTVGNDLSNLFDVQRVEILRGVQGTLFGRNTTGGALTIFYNPPELGVTEGRVRLRGDSWNGVGASAMVNVALGGIGAIRLVGDAYRNEGYGDGLFAGGHRGSRQYVTLRGSILLEPSDQLRAVLRADFTQAASTPVPYKATDMFLGSAANRAVVAELGLADTPANRIIARDTFLSYAAGDLNNDYSNVRPRDRGNLGGVSLSIDYEPTDNVTIRSITAYRFFDRFTVSDFDGKPFGLSQYDFYNMDDRQFSQEIQILGTAFSDRLNWIIGGYYSDENGDEGGENQSTIAISTTNPLTTLGIVHNVARGIFGQATYELFDGFSLTAGVRYSRDTRGLISGNETRTACTSLGVTLASLGTAPCLRELPDVSFGAWSYNFSAEYHPTQDIMVYARTSRGYRSGGQVLSGGSALGPVQATTTFTPFEPEFVTDYEVGFKSDWFGRRLRLNLTYYHSDYSNIQRNRTILAPGTTNLVTVTQNIAAAKVDGFEIETVIRPVAGLELSGHASYTDARFTDYTVNGVDLTATPFFYVPKWQYGGTAAYTAQITGNASLRAQIDYSWQGRYLSSGTLGFSEPGGTANARLTLRLDRPEIDIAVFARNLFNERFFTQIIDLSSVGYLSGFRNPPRLWGVEVGYRF